MGQPVHIGLYNKEIRKGKNKTRNWTEEEFMGRELINIMYISVRKRKQIIEYLNNTMWK